MKMPRLFQVVSQNDRRLRFFHILVYSKTAFLLSLLDLFCDGGTLGLSLGALSGFTMIS